jgi:hypothetical protein
VIPTSRGTACTRCVPWWWQCKRSACGAGLSGSDRSAQLAALTWLTAAPGNAQQTNAALARKPAVTEQEAHAIGVDAYLYFYPLVTMDITRRQATNIEPGKEFGKGPMNMFVSMPEFLPADYKAVVRPNLDTLYSTAWLDLTREPVVISAPDTGGRYYLLPMLDMWSDVVASPGWRTTGTQAGHFLVTPPGWTGTVPTALAAPPARRGSPAGAARSKA